MVRIVEAKNASAREKRIGEVNAGVYCFAPGALARALEKIRVNKVSGEYYLTDAVEILASGRGKVEAIEAEDWREAWGVNTRRDLAAAEEIERRRSVERALDSGVTVLDPTSVRIGPRVVLSPDVVLHPFVSLEGATELAEGCEIRPFTHLVDTKVAAGAVVGPHCEADGASIGPGRQRRTLLSAAPGPVLEEDVKSRQLRRDQEHAGSARAPRPSTSPTSATPRSARARTSAPGSSRAITTGTRSTRRGSASEVLHRQRHQLVAPVTVGDGAYVAAGTTITEGRSRGRPGARPRSADQQGRLGRPETGEEEGVRVD